MSRLIDASTILIVLLRLFLAILHFPWCFPKIVLTHFTVWVLDLSLNHAQDMVDMLPSFAQYWKRLANQNRCWWQRMLNKIWISDRFRRIHYIARTTWKLTWNVLRFNTRRQRQNGRHFDDMFKFVESYIILLQISPKYVRKSIISQHLFL